MGIINKLKKAFKRESKEEKEQREAKEKELDRRQAIVDAEYERDGLTASVLEKQIAINKERNKYDISDKSKMTDSNEGFVQ